MSLNVIKRLLVMFQTNKWPRVNCYRQTARIKSAYFKAVLRQDITFHEATSAGELSSRLAQ